MKKKFLTIDDYEITRDGKVINRHTGHILKPQSNGKGYLKVSIGGKLKYVHRLVAETYIPNPNSLSQINHIDGDKSNNAVENLEWVSNQENRDHAVQTGLHLSGEKCSWSKLNWEKVDFIREHQNEYTINDFSEMYNVSRSAISDVIKERTWKYEKLR